MEVLAKDQFVDALPEEDMRLRIRQNKPVMLRDALRLALELESYQLASGQRPKLVWGTHLKEGYLHQDLTTSPGVLHRAFPTHSCPKNGICVIRHLPVLPHDNMTTEELCILARHTMVVLYILATLATSNVYKKVYFEINLLLTLFLCFLCFLITCTQECIVVVHVDRF